MRAHPQPGRVALFGGVLAAVLAGCGGDNSENASSGEPADLAGALRIEIENFTFKPDSLQVRPGQEITVTNRDRAAHTVTADDGSIDSGELGQGESHTFTAPAGGAIPYICDLHQYMTGEIVAS